MNNTIVAVLQSLFKRDLKKLRKEIEAYKKEENIWLVEREIANTAGNLCLHLVGNLNTYIGAELGKTGYIRQRELEFSLKDVPRKELLAKIDQTMRDIDQTLASLSDEDLLKEYPQPVFGGGISTQYFLVHLATHLTYHLGQINYHRRLLDV